MTLIIAFISSVTIVGLLHLVIVLSDVQDPAEYKPLKKRG